MFQFFQVKTKLECQIDEYVEWKAQTSTFAAQNCRTFLDSFYKTTKCKDITEINLDQVQAFYLQQKTRHLKIGAMTALRGFMGYFRAKKQVSLDHRQITNNGVERLQVVGNNAIIVPMKKRRPGRPMNVALAKKIQALRKLGGMTYRDICWAVRKRDDDNPLDLKTVYRYANYDLTKF